MKKFTLAELQMLVLNDTVITTSGEPVVTGGTETAGSDAGGPGNTEAIFDGNH